MSEIWTAKRVEIVGDEEIIIFEILDESGGGTREETRFRSEIPSMLEEGGLLYWWGVVIARRSLPWRFRKEDGRIYLDGPSVGAPNYHPLDKER